MRQTKMEAHMRTFPILLSMLFLVDGCEKKPDEVVQQPAQVECIPPPPPPAPPTIKSKPTWVMRTFKDWLQIVCARDGTNCEPMGRVTILVAFDHNGCREFKREIENQSELIQGYALTHQFMLVQAASDTLTRALYDTRRNKELPCRVFLYDDTLKADQKAPNEDQQIVEICKDSTSTTEGECREQLFDKKLYAT